MLRCIHMDVQAIFHVSKRLTENQQPTAAILLAATCLFIPGNLRAYTHSLKTLHKQVSVRGMQITRRKFIRMLKILPNNIRWET